MITLVILFGPKKWDGPRTLHEMMAVQDPDILRHVADYRLNLIEPAAMEAEDFGKFRSNLRSVLGFIKYSNNGEELDAFFSREAGLRALDAEAARVIRECTNTNIQFDEKTEVVDVCKAVQELNEKARQEGSEKARLETMKNDIKNVMDSFKVSVEDAMNALKIGKEDRAILMKMI